MRNRRKEADKLLNYLKDRNPNFKCHFHFDIWDDLNIITLQCRYGVDILFKIDFYGADVNVRTLYNNRVAIYYKYQVLYDYWYDKLFSILELLYQYLINIKNLSVVDSNDYIQAEIRKKKLEQLINN